MFLAKIYCAVSHSKTVLVLMEFITTYSTVHTNKKRCLNFHTNNTSVLSIECFVFSYDCVYIFLGTVILADNLNTLTNDT